jgi:hypothetical protein
MTGMSRGIAYYCSDGKTFSIMLEGYLSSQNTDYCRRFLDEAMSGHEKLSPL